MTTSTAVSMSRFMVVSVTRHIVPVGDWVDDAACRGQKMFYDQFPNLAHRPNRTDRVMEAHALATCRECPVLTECRQWALQQFDPAVDHIAGGLTPRQRWDIRRSRERVDRGRSLL
jgi:hypothetical protein